MPSHEEHCQHSEKRYGVRGDDIHTWMDEPSFIMGSSHRDERHNPRRDLPINIKMFGNDYGEGVARQVFLDHILLDRKESASKQQYPNPEPSQPSPVCSPSTSFTGGTTAGGNLIETIGSIVFGFVVLWALNTAFGDPIGSWWNNGVVKPMGLWWSLNWFFVLGIIILIPVTIVVIYAFRDKNRIARALWKIIY